MHEHVMCAAAGIFKYYPELLGPRVKERILTALKQAKEGGIDTIVDGTTFDGDRNVSLLAEVSRESGVNIILAAGWMNPDKFIGNWSADQFAQLFIREINEGVDGTNIKVGILKSYADVEGVTPGNEVMLRAIARAHLRTNIPIMLHSYAAGQVGKQQLRILKEEGVDLKRVKVDHCLDTTDVKYLTSLAEQGCYLGVDRCPSFDMKPEDKAKTLKALLDAGWSHRLLPSHDYILVAFMPHLPPAVQQWLATSNPHGFLYMKKVIFPMLREMGVSDDTLNGLFINNPKNFFEGV